jgi:hypothetical protein
MTIYTKKEIQQRVLKNGKPLSLNKFCWDGKNKTFSSNEDGLVVDFANMNSATIKCGYSVTINCGDFATINCRDYATINCRDYATINCGDSATIDCGNSATIKCGYSATIDCWYSATINCGNFATINCGNFATIKCGNYATIKCGGSKCVIIRRDNFEVIKPLSGDVIQTCPYQIQGYIKNGLLNGEPHIIADGILSKVVNHKGNVYKVINHGDKKQTYLIKDGDNYAHGNTLKEAKESLIYKVSDRDTSKYNNLKLDSILTREEAIKCYMTITGACSSGTKYFVDSQENVKEEYSVQEIINLTKGQYNQHTFEQFFK